MPMFHSPMRLDRVLGLGHVVDDDPEQPEDEAADHHRHQPRRAADPHGLGLVGRRRREHAAAADAGLGHRTNSSRELASVTDRRHRTGTPEGRRSSVSVVAPSRTRPRHRRRAQSRTIPGGPRCKRSGGWPRRWPSPPPGCSSPPAPEPPTAASSAGTRSDLGDLIRAEQQDADDLTDRVERLRTDVEDATDRAGAADRRIGIAQRRSRGLELAAGTATVTGPSVTVTLADAPRSADRVLPEGTSPDDVVVHQQDVQAVVNALWAGGAEAMQIMDQRVVSTSAVRCVGNTLILQGRVYSPPYEITAIGDPDRLYESLDSAPLVDALPVLRRHLRPGLRDARRREDHPARVRRFAGAHARPGGSVIRTAVRGLGELFITAGLVVLLFVAYQLVWTNYEAHRAADQVADDIRDGWTRPPRRHDRPRPRRRCSPARASRSCTSRASAAAGRSRWSRASTLPDLARGVGHYPETARPGQVGNFAVAGHRATNGEPFAALDQVHSGRRRGRRDPGPLVHLRRRPDPDRGAGRHLGPRPGARQAGRDARPAGCSR